MQSGIYKILNRLNGKIYIGSTKNITKRIQRHKRDLFNNKHHNVHLQRSYNSYGNVFEFYILEYVEDLNTLFDRETYWIDSLSPEYNIGSVGGGDNYTNHPNSEELKKSATVRLQVARRPEPRYGADNPNWRGGTSKSYCACGKKKAINANGCAICRIRTGELNPFYGKTHSEETKDKLREAHTGKINQSCRKVLRVGDNIYLSATIAAKELGVSLGLITYRVKSNKYDYEYVKVEMPND